MIHFRSAMLGLLFSLFAGSMGFAGQPIGIGAKALLQASMQKHIDEKEANVDYYLAPRANSFFVFRALVDERKPLERLMKAAKVSRID
ncbi:MAG: hypothetical protein HOM58_06895 [Rhodospirillaceae bacterium]|nr:hypothetical protein [Rhodospirillaceae bacterium]MBT5458569.1 hypothetical protein [Rhodospirillaceae bacterium]